MFIGSLRILAMKSKIFYVGIWKRCGIVLPVVRAIIVDTELAQNVTTRINHSREKNGNRRGQGINQAINNNLDLSLFGIRQTMQNGRGWKNHNMHV